MLDVVDSNNTKQPWDKPRILLLRYLRALTIMYDLPSLIPIPQRPEKAQYTHFFARSIIDQYKIRAGQVYYG